MLGKGAVELTRPPQARPSAGGKALLWPAVARRLGVASVLAALITIPAGVEKSRAAEPLFGFNEGWHALGEEMGPAVRKSERAGADANRINVHWRVVEPIPGERDWSQYDRPYRRMSSSGQKPIISVMSAPCWANRTAECGSGNPPVPPDVAHMQAWSDFIRALLHRYPEISALQIWNEPNHGNFWSRPDPRRYVSVLEAADQAAASVAPGLPVIVAGLSPARMEDGVRWRRFLSSIYEHGAHNASDGIGMHLYPPGTALRKSNRKVVRGVIRQVRNARRIVHRASRARPEPIWVTEIGVSTDRRAENSVGLRRQARLLRRLYRSLKARRVASVIVHRLLDADSPYPWLSGLGVMHSLSRPKPAFDTIRSFRLQAHRSTDLEGGGETRGMRPAAEPPAGST